MARLKEFLLNYQSLEHQLISQICDSYWRTVHPKKSMEHKELSQMFPLAAVTLKANNDWWVVLEPGNVPTIYNHYVRFTIVKERSFGVTWVSSWALKRWD